MSGKAHRQLASALAADRAHQSAADDVLNAIQAIHRIRDLVQLSDEARLHYLRCIRRNLAAAEDHVADIELAPCVGEKMADIAHDHHCMEIEQ